MEEQQEDGLLLNIAFDMLFIPETVSIDNRCKAGLKDIFGDAWWNKIIMSIADRMY